jgi:activator of 2-hydroxyglutaryl-CoA dehydratase
MGTSYYKIYDSKKKEYQIIKSKDWNKKILVDIACGYNAKKNSKKVINELVALAKGAKKLINEENFSLCDIGSRDIKFIQFKKGNFIESDWNYLCGSLAGFTIELLGDYFQIDFSKISSLKEGKITPFNCGILGMGRIFDQIADGINPEEAVGTFIRSLAKNIYHFSKKPKTLYLSGGLCENPLFIHSFPCKLIPLGRFVLVEGLKEITNE